MEDLGPAFLTSERRASWHAIPGFLRADAADRLHRAVLDAPRGGHVVEVGSFAGRSLVCLAEAARARPDGDILGVTAIDQQFHPQWGAVLRDFDLTTLVE